MQWNLRYLAYARAFRKTPEDMLKLDTHRFPGGKMAGFMVWIQQRWKEWRAERSIFAFALTDKHHEDFDLWLLQQKFKKEKI